MVLCAVLLLCAVLCAGCSADGEAPDLGQYFSKEEIDSWKKEAKENKYTMNGGYYISFQGQLYPVEFEAGTIHWKMTPPDELFYVDLSELFTDSALTKRCAYLGRYVEKKLFVAGTFHHEGFLLDGDRPAYGSVLYFNETKMKQFTIKRGGLSCSVGADDTEIAFYGYITGERKEELYYHEALNLILSDEKGVFLEELNTVRKIREYARANGVPFDAYTEFTNLPYPSILFWSYLDADTGYVTIMKVDTVDIIADKYHISIRYLDERYQDFNCVVFVESENIQEFYREIQWNLKNPNYFLNIVLDDQGRVTQYFDKREKIQIDRVFESIEEFNAFVKQLIVIDPDTKQSLYFSKEENGVPFGGAIEYDTNMYGGVTHFSLYGVWKEYHTVKLHTPDETMESIVCINRDAVLPVAMRPGYAFEGWYADDSYSGQPITKIGYADSFTDLYAKFRKVDTYILSFEPCEGKSFENIQYVHGDQISLPYASKPFHVFKGWCVDPECETEPQKNITTEFYGSFHLYPCFEPQRYTITITAGEKTLHTTVRYGEDYTLVAYLWGDGFLGYFDENGVQYTDANGKSLAPFTDGADIQLVAKYKEN